MKPRIFISSTFYDLKYIREDLANFVRSYDYEPVLFEDGDIGYTPGKNLDFSCYESMRNSDMVILIIGGEYGSAASGERKDEFKEYMSITRNEFRTAVESGIPIFVMIDKKVMAEYEVYEANYNAIEKENMKMTFPTTKNINVFRFIKEIKGIVTLPIQEFERSADIKGFISKQWADMFKNYLGLLRNEKENKRIEDSVNEMKLLIQKMDIMLNSVGKNVLSKENSDEYDSVVNQQYVMFLCNVLAYTYKLELPLKEFSYNERKDIVRDLLRIIKFIEIEGHNLSINSGGESEKLYCNFKGKWGIDIIILNKEHSKMKIYDKGSLLYDDKNTEQIINIMAKEEFFNEFAEYRICV